MSAPSCCPFHASGGHPKDRHGRDPASVVYRQPTAEERAAFVPPKIERVNQPEGAPIMFWVGSHLVTLAEAADDSGHFPMLMLAPGAKWEDAAQTFAAWALDAEARATKAEQVAAALRDVATGRMRHLFAGLCPESPDDALRDPDCPACRALGVEP